MPIQLTPQAESRIQQKVERGLYPSPDAAIDVSLRLLDEYDRRLLRLRAAIAAGEDGEPLPWTPFLIDQLIDDAETMQLRGEAPDPDVCP
jgi:putative addiction module CopG family antidote